MSPLALNAFLNSTVSFTCSGRGSGPSLLFTTISWRVNGALVNTSEGFFHVAESNATKNSSLAYSTLSFTASPEFNNTSVLCTVSTVGLTPPSLEHADAPLAHLKLQGKEGGEREGVVSTALTCIVSVLLVYDVMFTLPVVSLQIKLSICCCCWVCIQ